MFKNKWQILTMVFVLTFISSMWLIFISSQTRILEENNRASFEKDFDDAVDDFELAISSTTAYIYGLRGFVYSQMASGISEKEFSTYAAETQSYAKSIKNYSIAPDNIQLFVYPIEGNEVTIGHNLNNDERDNVREDVRKVTESRTTVISGPYTLRQGGLGLIVRMPIVDTNDYWGMINIVIDVDGLIKRSGIINTYSAINFTMSKGEEQIFYGEEENYKKSLIMKEINFLNEKWIITGHYDGRYDNGYTTELSLIIVISLAVALLIAGIIINGLYRNVLLSDRIQHQIYRDTLTSLKNRRALNELIEERISKKRVFGLVFLDLDNFKNINDTLGHSIGDSILITIAERLSEFEQNGNGINIFRWGGDEFILILDDVTDTDVLTSITESAMLRVSDAIHIAGNDFKLQLSAGITMYPRDGTDVDDIIKKADLTMYHAKDAGRNRVESYSIKTGKEFIDEQDWAKKIDLALTNREMEMYYQPQLSLSTGKIVGAEALLRWKDTSGNFIPPSTIIPIAEKNQLIGRINQFVIEETIKQLGDWQRKGITIKIGINISAGEFDESLPNRLIHEIDKWSVDPRLVELELTESVGIKNLLMTQSVIKSLRTLGVKIALDDFGKGYSSLNYISKLDVTTIKIDYDFISKIENDEDAKKIVKSIIGLSKSLALGTIAEGVETIGQLDMLKEMSCHLYQGFLFSEAVSPEAYDQWLEQGYI